MWSNRYKKYGLIALIVLASSLVVWQWASTQIEHRVIEKESVACNSRPSTNTQRIECWLQIAFAHVRDRGLADGYTVFTYLYDTYPLFSSTGCHVYAHRMGDTAYYRMFVARGLTLQQMDFPQSTTACGYGFFHGFIEHLIQDHPDEKYVETTCEYLRKRLSPTMRDIGTICYHASGHGFMISQVDSLKKSMWGNPLALIDGPLKHCEAMPIADTEKEDCREGVFNVLTEWQRVKNFGLSQDLTHSLALCEKVAKGWRQACYYELGQQLGPIVGDSPEKAESLAKDIAEPSQRTMTFGVMIAGMMQSDTSLDRYENIFSSCAKLKDDEFYKICVTSAANGMMEHGSPGKEYERVLIACANPKLIGRGGDALCYDALAHRLTRFYRASEKNSICRIFPAKFRAICNSAS